MRVVSQSALWSEQASFRLSLIVTACCCLLLLRSATAVSAPNCAWLCVLCSACLRRAFRRVIALLLYVFTTTLPQWPVSATHDPHPPTRPDTSLSLPPQPSTLSLFLTTSTLARPPQKAVHCVCVCVQTTADPATELLLLLRRLLLVSSRRRKKCAYQRNYKRFRLPVNQPVASRHRCHSLCSNSTTLDYHLQ